MVNRRKSLTVTSILTIGSFVALLPLLYMIANSLKTYGETITRVAASPFNTKFWPKVPQWKNIPIAWEEALMGNYFLNSLIITIITLAGTLFVTIPAAYAFSKLKFPAQNKIFALLITTLIIPETVLLFPNYMIVSKLGWIDKLPALTIPFFGSAFFIFFLKQFFTQVPNELIESAYIDGANHTNILLKIMVPIANAPIFTMGFLVFIGAWNALQWPLIVTQTSKWRPISVGLASFISEAGAETQLRMAGSLIALAPVVILYVIAQKQITEAISRTGLKG